MRAHGYLAFTVGICLTVWACLFALDAQDLRIADRFAHDTDKVAQDTEARLKTYFDTLLGIRAVLAVDERIGRAEFHHYVRELGLKQRYPGFQALQLVRRVPEADLASHIDGVRRDTTVEPAGYPHYQPHPATRRDEHYLIDYTEPMRGNENAFGLDLVAFPAHLQALEMGRDTGQLVATERITLVQDASGEPGFIVRLPVYRKGAPLATVEQRRAALTMFVAIVFRVSDLMREVVDTTLLRDMHVQINDAGYLADGGGTPPSLENLMYDSAGRLGADVPASDIVPGLATHTTLNVGQRHWVMQFKGYPGGRYGREYHTILLIGGCGFLISTLIAALAVMLQRRREMARRLRVTLEELRALQDSAVVGIGLFSDGRIVRCNRGLEEMLGYQHGTLAGRPVTVLVPSTLVGDPFQCEAGGQRAYVELELVRRDGYSLWCLVNGRMLDPRAPEKGSVWVLADVSDRRKTEAALMESRQGLEYSLREVAQQKAHAEQAHRDMSGMVQTLQQAQASLITSEKMAALGALVAGIAHELNTPIGNSLLTATALADMVTEFERKLADGGGVRRSTLDAHLADARTACNIIATSLGKAADLITSFKQVAVDQTSDQRRTFALAGVLRDTLATYAAQLRRASCAVHVDVPETLVFDSYPGSVSQVLSNLINNVMLHAFEGREHGMITITAALLDDATAQLRFADNGVGMSGRTLNQVYDPFFTTKMGQGGSGLGMNIVYNIVTGVLKGTIRVESAPQQGTAIIITLPLTVPEVAAA